MTEDQPPPTVTRSRRPPSAHRRATNRSTHRGSAAGGEFITGPLLQQPCVVGKPLTRELAAYHCARRGAYRVIYRIDDKTHTVHVVRIDHRADVYHP